MSRVLSVVDNSIMVHIHDVVPNDILCVSNDERDPIIQSVERNGELVRFHYKWTPLLGNIKRSAWLDPKLGGKVFIHDLHNERAEFNGQVHIEEERNVEVS